MKADFFLYIKWDGAGNYSVTIAKATIPLFIGLKKRLLSLTPLPIIIISILTIFMVGEKYK